MIKPLALGITSILGAGVPSIAGAYYHTKQSIYDVLADEVIPEKTDDDSLNNIWQTVKSSLDSKQEMQDSEIKSKEAEDLKKWCFNAYKETYWSLFQYENKVMKQKVKTFCVRTIQEQLGSGKITFTSDEEDKKKLEPKINSLQSHDDKNGKLDRELTNLKNDQNLTDKWKKLRDWCKRTYNEGYQGDKSDKWKLIQFYCK